ncbi:hypothetical protein [Gayadomonas joobiniege]|uniref:hypothetical protein n=1 Tax=Gayadomonas joobiniege TaxID=1234606 RepID=UPI00037945B7|nr:hypothetical protein [Gayadomonas joobiniege]
MKLTFKHTAAMISVALTAGLSGCNFIGDSDPVFTEPAAKVQASGQATKYPLEGANVYACIVKSGCTTASENTITASNGFLGQSITEGPDGSFEIELNSEAQGKNVVFRILANASTVVPDGQCDTSDGDCGQDLTGLELKTIAHVEPVSEGEVPTLSGVQATVLSTLAVDILEADESFDEDTSTADLETKAKAASKGVAKMLGVDANLNASTENFFKLALPAATSSNLSGANENVKNLSMVNASFAKLTTTNSATMGAAIKEVATTIKNAVSNPSSVDTTTVATIKQLATVVKNETTANASTTGVTAPTTKEPDDVTEDSIEEIAEETQDEVTGGGNGGTGGTGGTGGSTGGSNG